MRAARTPLLALLALLAGAAPASAADGFMSLQDFRFAPDTAQIGPGERVLFNFEGPSAHDVVIRAGQIDRYHSGTTGAGSTKAHRFDYPGSFALLCDIHPEMTARVLVGPREVVRPRITRVRARPGRGKVRLSMRVSERSVVRVAVGGRRVTKVLPAGARSITVGRLRSGRRTARITAKDGWGNRSAAVEKSFTVR